MARPTKKNPEGKQKSPKLTEDTIRKLEEAFSIDASVKEACYYADISTDTFYRWIKKYPKLSYKLERLREKPVLKARQTVVKSLDNPDYAFKYLERKKKDEFSPRQELTGKDGESIQTSYEIKLNEIRKEYGNEGSKCTKGTRKNIR
jgi:hypothetical protein